MLYTAEVSLCLSLILVWPSAPKNYVIPLQVKYQLVLRLDCMKKVGEKIHTSALNCTG